MYPSSATFSQELSGICDIYGPYVFPKDPESITSLNQGQIGNILGVADFSELKNLTGITNINSNYGFSSINLNSKSIINFDYVVNGEYLSFLNLNNCSNLSTLNCGNPLLSFENLSIAGCTGLTNLNCSNSAFTNLNLNEFNNLTSLNCSYNQITGLNVSGCSKLTSLSCVYNQLANLNLAGLTGLTTLGCQYNSMTNLNIAGCTTLNTLNCSYN